MNNASCSHPLTKPGDDSHWTSGGVTTLPCTAPTHSHCSFTPTHPPEQGITRTGYHPDRAASYPGEAPRSPHAGKWPAGVLHSLSLSVGLECFPWGTWSITQNRTAETQPAPCFPTQAKLIDTPKQTQQAQDILQDWGILRTLRRPGAS